MDKEKRIYYTNATGVEVTGIDIKLNIDYKSKDETLNLCDIVFSPEQAKLTSIMLNKAIEEYEKEIEETIKKPTIVYKAKTFPEKRLHFIRKTNKKEISQYNNVIVEYNDNNKRSAHVTTSFYSDEIGKGGGDCVYFNYNNNI